jgi:hypothetical protein
MTDDERWGAWCADFDEVVREMTALFHTRWMWRTITDLLEGVDQHVLVNNYLLRTYVGTVCTAVRREVDRDSRTTSLARCLTQLIESPYFATRSRYAALVREAATDLELIPRGVSAFDRFAPNGGQHVDPTVVQSSLDRLDSAAGPIRKYTNQVLAHRQRKSGEVDAVSVSFPEINHALDELGAVTKEYWSLRHPGQILGNLTPITGLDFLHVFDVPWRREGFQVRDVWDD